MVNLDPRVKDNWIRAQKQHSYPVNAIGMRISPDDHKTLEIWREAGLEPFVKTETPAVKSPANRMVMLGATFAIVAVASAIGGWKLFGARPNGPGAGNTIDVQVDEQGVTPNEIVLGMSAAFSGPAQELGIGMRAGIEACFKDVNAKGGVHGRKLRLITLDDGYEPDRCLTNMHDLLDKQKVFATIGNVGTPTAKEAVPFTMERKRIFFGAYTGAGLLRKTPPDRYVFNYRCSYEEETGALVKFLVEVKRVPLDQIAVFAQNDAYGDSGHQGVLKMIESLGGEPTKVLRVGYERNTDKVEGAAEAILAKKNKVKAIIMVPAYEPAAKFVKLLRDLGNDVYFASVSFVNSGALAEEFKKLGSRYAEGVIVAQTVPHYHYLPSNSRNYERCMKNYAPNQPLGFISLEGYIAARLFVAALDKNGPVLTTDRLIETLESIRDLKLETGGSVTLGPSEHQGSHTVWGTILDARGEYIPVLLD